MPTSPGFVPPSLGRCTRSSPSPSKHKEDMKKLQASNDKAKRKLEDIKKKNQLLQEEVKELQRRNMEALQKENSELRRTMELQKENSKLIRTMEALQKENSDLKIKGRLKADLMTAKSTSQKVDDGTSDINNCSDVEKKLRENKTMTILSKDAPAEIAHTAHRKHDLKLVATRDVKFECNGCCEGGAGTRYTCPSPTCNFNLHKDCARAEPMLVHPLLKEFSFKLCLKPPSKEKPRCDACGKKVRGWHYHCDEGDLDLHPCCAKLPMAIPQEEHTLELRLEIFHECNICGERGDHRKFWFYRSTSTSKTIYLHVRCAKEAADRCSSTGKLDLGLLGSDTSDTMQKRGGKKKRAGGNFERICKMVAAVLRIIVAVIIGDPTPIIVAAVPAVIGLLAPP